MTKEKALVLKTTQYALNNPKEVARVALIIKTHIIKNNLYVPIAGRNYVMVEGWQFGGGLLGLFPRIADVQDLGQGKWMAKAEILHRDKIVSVGYAICSKAEARKAGFDEYAILSMAQTRAIGKAYRNIIGWIIKMAGYEATPAEEMQGIGQKTQSAEKIKEEKSAENRSEAVEKLKSVLGGKTNQEKLAYLKKRTGVELHSFNIPEAFAKQLYARILSSQVKPNA